MIALLAQAGPEVLREPDLSGSEAAESPFVASVMGFLNSYSLLFIVAFVVTLLVTPLVRRAAISADIVDHPDAGRKQHPYPVAYLGGIAVFLGLLIAVAFSYLPIGGAQPQYQPIPLSILIGIVAITVTGLADDIWKWDPRLKIAGQLVAAAALAIEDVGVRVAEGALKPIVASIGGNNAPEAALFAIEWMPITNGDLYYWVGTAIIAIFVLGGCNAANLVDGLDGLLSGLIALVAIGLLAVSILMAVKEAPTGSEPTLAGARVALCFALLGAVLGFLPHNFNPATIFLGDCGSLLLGYVSVVIILMLGHTGQTPLVFAGLIVFAIPIMDTVLAIVRRKLSGRPMSSADDQHIHHQLRRGLGSVKKAVFALYAIGVLFAVVGVTLAYLIIHTELRVRVIYAIAIVLFGSIGVFAFKAARRAEFQAETERLRQRAARLGQANGDAARPRAPETPMQPVTPASKSAAP
ncbi:MAG: undecaprenyl/decaprenyl-phosphate alpha-N-acetylglucosaminyl 1-phosphate transferase [Phycisphaerales bacterium]|nr:undecaprenyl/decaprenyl-phosphate alpha-N-acetylglucosaminyl 1-phosphate transferase [Phycisphaerales bacterium]